MAVRFSAGDSPPASSPHGDLANHAAFKVIAAKQRGLTPLMRPAVVKTRFQWGLSALTNFRVFARHRCVPISQGYASFRVDRFRRLKPFGLEFTLPSALSDFTIRPCVALRVGPRNASPELERIVSRDATSRFSRRCIQDGSVDREAYRLEPSKAKPITNLYKFKEVVPFMSNALPRLQSLKPVFKS
ncbi:hypothetical protein FF011L_04230 [Roseimaritima multifibrata]|uniref:Uncharacterized protein n=1 Tax=Roseimaritima multifibrata TaxID=1930274 RepID=A0A517M9X2_9BACT|nr:hypothetical protein FF011L_04230 [Roseimaritima multifibrata]